MSQKHETGIWNVQYPSNLRAAVQATAEQWTQFCELSDEAQDVFTAASYFNGVGFERKAGTGTENSRFSNDRKLNFDITQQGSANLYEKANTIPNPREREIAHAYLDAATNLTRQASSAIEAFGATIEQEYSVSGFRVLATQSAPNAFFRCLYYPPTTSDGEIIGEPHVDNSGFTLHLYESTSGCEALSRDKETWYPMPVAEGSALAFPSMQTQLFSHGEIDGLCHRIVSNKTTMNVGRYAIVCFVPLSGVAQYDRARHGRLQEKTPGFNYWMEDEEFAELFVQ